MEQLTYISSAGLRVILLIAKALERQNVKFGVCSLSDPIREIFDISGFDKVVKVRRVSERGYQLRAGLTGHCLPQFRRTRHAYWTS